MFSLIKWLDIDTNFCTKDLNFKLKINNTTKKGKNIVIAGRNISFDRHHLLLSSDTILTNMLIVILLMWIAQKCRMGKGSEKNVAIVIVVCDVQESD